MFLLFAPLALCMEVVKDDIFMSQIFPKHIQDNPGTCSHNTICALALVSKEWNEFIKNARVQRRRYFAFTQEYRNLHMTQKEIYQQQVWHKNNSAYVYWMEMEDGETQFCLTYLDGNDKISTSECTDASLTIPIFKNYRPFFTAQGNACCHAWHEENITGRFVELSLNTIKLPKIRTCYLDLNCKQLEQLNPSQYFLWVQSIQSSPINRNKLQPSIIKNCPVLLKTFIDSQHVEETNDEKIYHLDGVIIDENYLLHGSFPTNWWRQIVSQNCIVKK